MSQNRSPSKQQQILDTVTEIKTVVIGIPGTDDRGMAGAIKDIKTDHAKLSDTVGRHSEAISRLATFHEDDPGMSRKKKIGIWGAVGGIIAGGIAAIIRVVIRSNQGG